MRNWVRRCDTPDEDGVHDRDRGVRAGGPEQHPQADLVAGPGLLVDLVDPGVRGEHGRVGPGQQRVEIGGAGVDEDEVGHRRSARALPARGAPRRRTGPPRPGRRRRPPGGPAPRRPGSARPVAETTAGVRTRRSRSPRRRRRPGRPGCRGPPSAPRPLGQRDVDDPCSPSMVCGSARRHGGIVGQPVSHGPVPAGLHDQRHLQPGAVERSAPVGGEAERDDHRSGDRRDREDRRGRAAGSERPERTWSRARRAETSRSTNGRATGAEPREDDAAEADDTDDDDLGQQDPGRRSRAAGDGAGGIRAPPPDRPGRTRRRPPRRPTGGGARVRPRERGDRRHLRRPWTRARRRAGQRRRRSRRRRPREPRRRHGQVDGQDATGVRRKRRRPG